MKITGLSHIFKWENLHNWWLTKYFFAPLYILLGIPSSHNHLTHWPQHSPDHNHLITDHPHLQSSISTPSNTRSSQCLIVRSTVHLLELSLTHPCYLPACTCLLFSPVLQQSRSPSFQYHSAQPAKETASAITAKHQETDICVQTHSPSFPIIPLASL